MAAPRARTSDPAAGRAKQHGPITLHDVPRRVPALPKQLTLPRAKALWRELWRSPVSALWRLDEDGPLVVRVILLRVRIEREGLDAAGWLYGALQAAEDRLLLNPRARRTAGVVIEPPDDDAATSPASNGKRRGTVAARRRQRILRAIPPPE